MTTATRRFSRTCLLFLSLCAATAAAQINVTTFHYDNARTGQDTSETVLTPANVNSNQFGKLFTTAVDGYVYAQPLYLANVTISGAQHNVLYIATEHDSVFAIDADNGAILWQTSFINPAAGITSVSSTDAACTDLVPEIGITSTPVIDPVSGIIYVVAKTKENGSYFQRLHALSTTTGSEVLGGPMVIAPTYQTKVFDPLKQHNRPGLLLENGHVIVAWASHCDNGPYQGWLVSYNASNLSQEAVFNTEPDATSNDGGIWMSGDGVAADANGNLFFATGNGDYDNNHDFGSSIMKLSSPTSGSFTVLDWFTAFNQSSLNGGDTDLGAGGVLLLPDLPAGSPHQQLLVEMGKEGKIYLIDRNNMGKFCSTCTSMDTNIVQEIPGAATGIWGAPAYWNGTVYWGGGRDGGNPDHVKAWSFNANNSGLLSISPTSESSKSFSFSTAAPVISANGTSNGILWILDNSQYGSACCQVLYAYDATNLGTMLYNSSQAANSRDVPGGAVKFTSPVVANGKVYVGSQGKVSAFGIISSIPTAAAPAFNPAPGNYSSGQSVTLSDATAGAAIHYSVNGSTPTASSPVYTSPISVTSNETIKAIAMASGFSASPVSSGTYAIGTGTSGASFAAGFSGGGMTLNGSAAYSGTRLRLTNGGTHQAGSGFLNTSVNIQKFTTDFSFQLASPSADGFAFVLQNSGTTALGASGGELGYTGIGNSIAVKFDLYNNGGEGINSTGLFMNGVSPYTPAITLGGGVNLHSGDVFNVHITYDGATLTMTITDAGVPADTFTTSWAVNIPGTVGANTALAGFTGGTGGTTATQDIISWTFNSTSTTPSVPIVYQAESVPATGVPDARVFSWSGFTNGSGIIVDATQVGNSLTLTLNVAQAGTYDVKYGAKLYLTRGIGQLSVGGVNVGPTADQYANSPGLFKEFDAGNVSISAPGNYQFKFTVTGKNPGSTGYSLAFDYIKLTPQ